MRNLHAERMVHSNQILQYHWWYGYMLCFVSFCFHLFDSPHHQIQLWLPQQKPQLKFITIKWYMINIPLLQKFKGPYWAAVYVKVLEWKQNKSLYVL